MSWDVWLMSVPDDIATPQDLPEGYVSDLGPLSQVSSTLTAILPDLDLTDPMWGVLDRSEYCIEFDIGGGSSSVDDICLHVRGDDSAIHPIKQICQSTDWRAVDMSTFEFINFAEDPTKGLREWRTFRDRVVVSLEAEGKQVITDPNVGGIRVDSVQTTKPIKKRKWWEFWKKKPA